MWHKGERERDTCRILVRKYKGRRYLGRLMRGFMYSVKQDVWAGTGFIWLGFGTADGLL